MAMIGYARVSTTDQNPEMQAARLRAHDCSSVFTDVGGLQRGHRRGASVSKSSILLSTCQVVSEFRPGPG
jgi:predicted site-specific integrase-resolvase